MNTTSLSIFADSFSGSSHILPTPALLIHPIFKSLLDRKKIQLTDGIALADDTSPIPEAKYLNNITSDSFYV